MNLLVPAAAISSNSLAELGTCPLHDLPGISVSKRKFYTATPAWTLLLVLISLLVGLIVMLAIRKEVSGAIADCATCVASRKRYRYTVISAWVLVLGLLFALAGSSSGALVLLWFVLLVAAFIYSFAGNRSRVAGVLTKDQGWVELKKVAPGFASKVHVRMNAARR